MNIFTNKKISPSGKLNKADIERWCLNLLKFTAPALAVFFTQLSLGVDFKVALLTALLGLYGAIADLLNKFKDGKK